MNKQKPRLFFSIIRTQLIAIILSFFVGYIFISNQISEFIIKESINENNNIAISIEAFLDEELDEPMNVLNSIENTLLNNNLNDEQIIFGLDNFKEVYQYFDDIEIINQDGMVLYTLSNHLEEIGFDRSNEPSIKILNQTNQDVYWSNINLSPYTNVRTISISIKSKSGYITGYFNLDFIKKTTFGFISKLNKNVEIIITDEFGTYLIYKNDKYVDERRIYSNINNAKTLVLEPTKNIYFENNEKYLLSAIQMKNTNWIIAIEQPYKSAIFLLDYFIKYFSLFALIFLLVFMLWSFFGLNKIIKNIYNFSRKFSDLNINKNLNKHINYFQEFESLEISFNNMKTIIAEKDEGLRRLAYIDSLTSLYNRTYLIDKIIPVIDDNIIEYVVVYIDLDNFSYINDTFGHLIGDKFLSEFSKLIQDNFLNDTIIRLGGDEFLVIITHKDEFNTYIEERLKIIKFSLEETINISDINVFLTFSAGYSLYPNDGKNFYEILKNADLAMYNAKSQGKNYTSCFIQTMNHALERKILIEQQLRKAIEKNEFSLVFQPQVNLENSEIRGFESLIRWENELLGNVNTLDFIKIAEENRFIIELDLWVIEESCKFIKKINDAFSTNFIICINASPIELKHEKYIEDIKNFIKKYNIKPHWLEIEITENISIDDFKVILPQLLALKMNGISIAIDDFGTGYSSLSYLQNMPLDVLKIDKIFINEIDEDINKNQLIITILLLAKNLGLKVIAEGVETENQKNVLKALGCDYGQGYLFSKPKSSNELRKYLNLDK